jgi:transcriptional regulator of acetoin/glycerol metabolism
MRKRIRQPKRSKKVRAKEQAHLGRLRKQLGLRTLAELKHIEVRKAVAATKGDKQLAAALLGIGKTTLYRFLAQQAD